MPFGIIGRAGPGMRQVLGFGDRSIERGTFGGEFAVRHCNQWGNLRRTCATVPQPSELPFGWCVRWAGAFLYYMGVYVVQGKGEVLGVLVPHFHNGKCHYVADGEMFPIRMRKLDNISVRQTYQTLESSIRGLFGDIFNFKIKVGVDKKLAKT